MTHSRLASLATAIILTCVLPQSLSAQTRSGFWFSGGLGFGSLGCEDCDAREGGVSGGISLGGTISPNFLLGGGTAGWAKSEDGVTLTVSIVDARVRYYPSVTSGFFLTGGLGLGTIELKLSQFGSASQTGVGALVGVGYDARIGTNVSLTPFLNGFAVRTEDANANVGQFGLAITVH